MAYTPQGLAVAGSEGALRSAANAALLALVHAKHSSGFGAVRLACWARDQVSLGSPITARYLHTVLTLIHMTELHLPAPPCSVRQAWDIACRVLAATDVPVH